MLDGSRTSEGMLIDEASQSTFEDRMLGLSNASMHLVEGTSHGILIRPRVQWSPGGQDMSERSDLSAPHEIMQIDPEPCEDRQIIRAGDARAPQKGAREPSPQGLKCFDEPPRMSCDRLGIREDDERRVKLLVGQTMIMSQ